MKKISIKSLQKQLSQASDFYGKSNVLTEEFFRYYISPFLAKELINVKCSNELFQQLNKDITKQNTIEINVDEINLPQAIEAIDKKVNKFEKIIWVIFYSVCLAGILVSAFIISSQKTLQEIFGYSIGLAFTFGFLALVFFDSLSRSITIKYTSSLGEYRNVVSWLQRKFSFYKNELEYWSNLSWQDFEREITKRFIHFGCFATNTRLTGDEGVDIVIHNKTQKFIIQCKATKSKIGPAYVRDFAGTLGIQGGSGGMIISLNGFSSGAPEATSYSNLYLFSISEFLLLDKQKLNKIIGW